jgi:integrase
MEQAGEVAFDAILDRSPADYARRPSVPSESPTLGLSHLQFEAIITAARTSSNPYDFALVAMLGLLGLRIFEACAVSVGDLGEEHGHRVLRVCGKGSKVVLIPLPPAVGRAIDRAVGERVGGPILLNRPGARMDRHAATRRLKHLAAAAGGEDAKNAPTHAAPHLRHHDARRRCTSPGRTDRRSPRRPQNPQCATTAPARTSTATTTTSSPRSCARHPKQPHLPMNGPPGRTHSCGPSPVRAKRSRLRYRTGLPSDSA